MGLKQSFYEKCDSINYIKLTLEEQTVIKNIWSGIEKNPQLHGTSYFTSFLEKYPQYIKFFTLELYGPINIHPRITAKFTMIMETMGYLLLDFHNKPKQMDRLIGYIAMIHKDMHLDEQDILNFGSHLLEYLTETFPEKMTAQNYEIQKKFMFNIFNQMYAKMEAFRDYESRNSNVAQSLQLSCSECTFFPQNLILGKPKSFWDDLKNQWNTRQNEWKAQESTTAEPAAGSSTDDEDTLVQTPKVENNLMNLTRKLNSENNNTNQSGDNKELEEITSPLNVSKFIIPQHESPLKHPSGGEGMSPRERYRAQNTVREAFNSYTDGVVLRKRIRTSRILVEPVSSQLLHQKEEAGTSYGAERVRKFSNTARERRRETKHFGVDLQ